MRSEREKGSAKRGESKVVSSKVKKVRVEYTRCCASIEVGL